MEPSKLDFKVDSKSGYAKYWVRQLPGSDAIQSSRMRPSSAPGMMFVFSVCRLVSRRCHNISAIHQLCLKPSQNRTSGFPTSGSSFNHSALQKGSG